MFRDKSANHAQAGKPKPKSKSKYVLGAVLLMNLGIGWAVTAGVFRICGLRDESSLNSEAATHQTSSAETPGITQQEWDALAGRIAAVLRKRKKLGAERRIQELEYQRLNRERALARHYRLRGEYAGGS